MYADHFVTRKLQEFSPKISLLTVTVTKYEFTKQSLKAVLF